MCALTTAWRSLDAEIRTWWDGDLRSATENEIRAGVSAGPPMLFLPFPYIDPFPGELPGDATGTARVMYAWDTYFINQALLLHDRFDLVRNHIGNYLFMVERFGHMPNANVASALTRSQVPVLPDGIWQYFVRTQDADLLMAAYPTLKREYRNYWCAAHHQTSIGLATNRDLGDASLPPALAAEAETGLDWTPIFGGDVRRCVPLITNCALVRFARVLALMGEVLGRTADARQFTQEADARAELIRKFCWNEDTGFFHEYDYESGTHLPYLSLCAYWTMWAGVASTGEAARLVDGLPRLERPHGMASTDRAYADVRATPGQPGGLYGADQLQWMYPAGWAPEQLIVMHGLRAYGYDEHAERIGRHFLTLVLDEYERTGRLWEKYNVVDGGVSLPNARYGNATMHGWTAAAVVVLGHLILGNDG